MLLGIDIGLTASKAVVFDDDGRVVSAASRATRNRDSGPGMSERDSDEFWSDLAGVIREAVVGIADKVVGVGVAAHGDGLWLVDEELRAVRPGITSLDSRAGEEAALLRDRMGPQGLATLGKLPLASHATALLAWVRRHEPRSLERAAWALSTKDFVQSRLTGRAVTDLTDASSSFADVGEQRCSPAVMRLQGLGELFGLIPPVLRPDGVVGTVTATAATATGLRQDTAVVAGLHDTCAAALGCAANSPGDVSLLSGTFSINQQVIERPEVDTDWTLHSFVRQGQWIRDSSSPASSANLEWFMREFCADTTARVGNNGGALLDLFGLTGSGVAADVNRPFFVPHLNGTLADARHSGAFVGLRAAHTRSDLLFSVVESLAFNHRQHLGHMGLKALPLVRVAGGISRNPWWRQLLADVLNSPVVAPRVSECGALGAAIVAGSGSDVFTDIGDGVDRATGMTAAVSPSSDRSVSLLDHRYQRYVALLDSLRGWWEV